METYVNSPEAPDSVRDASNQQILDAYRRRESEVAADLYAPWHMGEVFRHERRRRLAADMLHRTGVFPKPEDHCLEVGHGTLGWLADLIGWGVPSGHLHGIELDARSAEVARTRLPSADLRIGDATEMPWTEETFHLVIASTVFSSILDPRMRKMLAREITRVLAPGGALLCYDFAMNNPRNPNVRKLTRRELAELFPDLHGQVRSLTLAPPIARLIAPRCWWLATILEMIPFLRTHLLAVLIKRPTDP